MVEVVTDLHFILHRLQFITILQWIWTLRPKFFYELDDIELAVLEAPREVDLAKPSNGQAVVNLILEEVIRGGSPKERIEKFCFLDESFFKAETVVEIYISI